MVRRFSILQTPPLYFLNPPTIFGYYVRLSLPHPPTFYYSIPFSFLFLFQVGRQRRCRRAPKHTHTRVPIATACFGREARATIGSRWSLISLEHSIIPVKPLAAINAIYMGCAFVCLTGRPPETDPYPIYVRQRCKSKKW